MVWNLFSFYLTGFLFFFDGIVVGDDPQQQRAFSPKEHKGRGMGAWLRGSQDDVIFHNGGSSVIAKVEKI